MLFVLFPGYGDDRTVWQKAFINELEKMGTVWYPPDINTLTKLNIKQYVKSLEIPYDKKTIVICHSIGSWFAYELAKIRKVYRIISLDGTLIGKYILNAVNRVKSKKSGDVLLRNLVTQAPLKATAFPAKTICFRNIVSAKDIKDKELDSNTQAILESAFIKNLTVKFYVNASHYLHNNKRIQKEIIETIKKL